PVNPNPPEEPDDPVIVTHAEIIAALDENCIAGIVNATRVGGLKQDKQFIVDGTWYLTKDNNSKITKAEYAYIYQKSNTSAYYVITEVNFETATSLKDIKDANFNATYNNVYKNANYNPTIQDSYAELTQVICNKAFGESDTATRYIIDTGSGIENHSFTVIQIENGNVKEANVCILSTSNFLENFKNGNHSNIISGKTYNLSGEKLIAE
ncbi:MAG: hypothetical protein K2I29_04700, partial [Clostridia bacterium]|nr:hypothetical protein [Clostridia bacterium]